MTNAVRHGSPRSVEVRLTEQGDQHRLSVEDDGGGTAEDIGASGGQGILGIREIAETLAISPKTVQNNHHRIKAVLGAKTVAQLVWIAIRAGLVSLESASHRGDRM